MIDLPGQCPTCTSDDPAATKQCSVGTSGGVCVMPHGHFDRDELSYHLTASEAEGRYRTDCDDGWHQAYAYALSLREGDPFWDLYEHEAIHTWFNLTYANYLVMPRSVLQSMPNPWQRLFALLLDQADQRFGGLPWPHYTVQARDGSGRFTKDPIPHYNRGRTTIDPTPRVYGAAS